MTRLLTRLLGRLPIGWLQLTHNRGRLASALAGVAFANILVFMQLGFLGTLVGSIQLPYQLMDADLLIQASDANTLQDGSPLPRARMSQAEAVPGVAEAVPIWFGRLDWKQTDGTVRNLDVLGIDPRRRAFRSEEINAARHLLTQSNTALVDRLTRNVNATLFTEIDAGRPYRIEANQRGLTFIRSFALGGGFTTDGYMVVSDITFLKLFRQRDAGAPNFILLRAAPGEDLPALADRLRARLPSGDTAVRTVAAAAARDQRFQTTQKPVGVVFGFGIVIGALVGIVIVYQILATDVADHLREYATFKAIGYRQGFFLGIVFEEATILALCGFVPGFLISLGLYKLLTLATGLPMLMSVARPFFVFIGTLLMCALSGAIATRRLARADPADLF